MTVKSVPIQDVEEIEFGAAETSSTKGIGLIYEVIAQRFAGNIATGSDNPLVKMLETAKLAYDHIVNKTNTQPDYDNATCNAEMIMMNIGRLARKSLDAYGLQAYLDVTTDAGIIDQLAMRSSGVVATTRTLAKHFKQLWFVFGTELKELIGEWNITKYEIEDEAFAGIWLTLIYVTFWWDQQLLTWKRLLGDIGRYALQDSIERGNFVPLDPIVEKTWGSVLIATENTNTKNYFGLSTSQIDDATLKGIPVLLWDMSLRAAARLWSQTRWTWKYGRWVEVRPLYTIWSSLSESDDDGVVPDTYSDTGNGKSLGLFLDGAVCNWKWFNRYINDFYSTLNNFFFKNKHYATLKKRFKLIPFAELPTIAAGNGGLLAHQMTFLHEEATTDDMSCKLRKDTNAAGHCVLTIRRATSTNNRFMVIGDVELDDYLFWVANNIKVTPVKSDLAITRMLDPQSAIYIPVLKSEEEPYRLDKTVYYLIRSDANGDLNGKELDFQEWSYHDSTDQEYPVMLHRNKAAFYANRPKDPYKKLTHRAYDVNHLDMINLRDVLIRWIIGSSVEGEAVSTPIAVSAIPDGQQGPFDRDYRKQENKDVTMAETPVSAKPEKKEDKKEDKKEK